MLAKCISAENRRYVKAFFKCLQVETKHLFRSNVKCLSSQWHAYEWVRYRHKNHLVSVWKNFMSWHQIPVLVATNTAGNCPGVLFKYTQLGFTTPWLPVQNVRFLWPQTWLHTAYYPSFVATKTVGSCPKVSLKISSSDTFRDVGTSNISPGFTVVHHCTPNVLISQVR